jgi:hypothetical protein
MARSRGPLLVLLLLATAAVAAVALGLAGDDGGQAVTVPTPTEGTQFAYRGTNGTYLNATVAGEGTRLGADLRSYQGVQVHWTVENAPTPHNLTVVYNETVAPEGGLVQVVTPCGLITKPEGGEWACDARALSLFPTSLPGAFGAGPFWGEAVEGPERVHLESARVGTAELVYDVEPVDETGRDCARLEAATAAPEAARPVMWGVLEGPLVLCEDLALPASFTVASQQLGSRFELVDRRPGDGPRLAPEAQVEDRAPVRVEHRSWEPPFLVDPDGPGLAAGFPVPEAHQAALDGSGSYAELFGEPGDALVVDTNVIQSGRRDTGVDEVGRSSETYNRSLTAVGEDGSAVQVWVEKTYETVRVGPENVTLENADVTGDRELEFPDHPTVDTAEPRQATLASALDLGDRLVDTSPQILVQEATVDDVSRSAGDELGREDGYALQLWMEDPQPESGNLPPGITAPYGVRVDGPTGDLLQVDVPAGELPLTVENLR